MLLIKVAERSFQPTAPPEQEKKITFWDVHRRDPRDKKSRKELGERLLDKGLADITYEELEILEASAAWRPEAKDPKEIKVTPTVLKESPVLETEGKREAAVKETLQTAARYLRKIEANELQVSVAPSMMHAVSILVDVLQMTTEEIMRDGEAMGDLVEFLEEVARYTPDVWGHSSLLREAAAGNPDIELINLIKGTWEFPESPFGSPLMYSRVDWTKKNHRPREN